MILEFQASGMIQARAEDIWAILTDAKGFSEWDPYCEKIEGSIAKGEKIKAFSTLAPGRAFPVTVSVFEPQEKMVWSSALPLGLFKGERTFSLEQRGDTEVEFTVSEVFSGLLLGLFAKSIPDMTEPFEKFVEGLKARAEG